MNVAFKSADECELTVLRFKPKEFGLTIKKVIFSLFMKHMLNGSFAIRATAKHAVRK